MGHAQGVYPAVLRAYYRLCTQGTLLALLRRALMVMCGVQNGIHVGHVQGSCPTHSTLLSSSDKS